jgi:hypothetical protein
MDTHLILGVAWYRREQWELLRALSVDVETLEETYDEWLKQAEYGFRTLGEQGISARKIIVDVNEIQAWCIANDRPLDGNARSEYVAQLLRSPSR